MKSWNRSIRQVQFQNNIFQFTIDFFSPKEANPERQWAMSNSGNTHRKADFSCAKPRVSNTDRSTCSATSFAWKKEIKHKISFPILPNPSSSRSTPEINKRHWTVIHWCTRLKFVLSQISFSLLEVRKIHEKMENQLEMGKIRRTLKSLFYFFFLTESRAWLEARVWTLCCSIEQNIGILLHFRFAHQSHPGKQSKSTITEREQLQGGFIYLGFSGSFSIALNASKHSLYNSRIYLRQQRTEEKYKHNIYWTGRVFFLLSLKGAVFPLIAQLP